MATKHQEPWRTSLRNRGDPLGSIILSFGSVKGAPPRRVMVVCGKGEFVHCFGHLFSLDHYITYCALPWSSIKTKWPTLLSYLRYRNMTLSTPHKSVSSWHDHLCHRLTTLLSRSVNPASIWPVDDTRDTGSAQAASARPF